MSHFKETDTAVRATSSDTGRGYGTNTSGASQAPLEHGDPQIVEASPERPIDGKKTWGSKFAYFRTKEFWFILLLGQILAICITGTNTLTTLLVIEGTSIPAFQTLFNYVLLNLIYTSYTIYQYGFKKWARLLLKDGWKCELCTINWTSRVCVVNIGFQISFWPSLTSRATTSLCWPTVIRPSCPLS